MPKIKKTIPREYTYTVLQESVAASATMIFSTLTQLTYFGNGGTSFVLENTDGYKVRFAYVTIDGAINNLAGGYFRDDNDLQPRYIENNVIESAYYNYEDYDYNFFGYGWNQDTDSLINAWNQGAAVYIYYGDISGNLVSSDQNLVTSAVETLVERTVRAIKYAKEVKMSASILNGNTSLQITQQVKGPEGNTDLFRGYPFGTNLEGNYYSTLTSDITTTNFENGADGDAGDVINWTKRSGNLGNAIKRRINKQSFEIGSLPINQRFTGQKIDTIMNYFDDSLTFDFLNNNNQRIDVRLGVPYAQQQSAGGFYPDFILDNPIISNDYYRLYENQNTAEIGAQSLFVANNHANRRLSNSNVFSTPNTFQNLNINNNADFIYYSKDYNIFKKASKLNQKNIDLYLDKINTYESIKPYNETNKIIEFKDSQWQTTNTGKSDYNISESKQISLELGFNKNNQGSPAILLDTANNFINQNKISLDHVAITRFSQHTSYYNFSNNTWDYLHHYSNYPGNNNVFGDNGINDLPYSKDYLQTINSKEDFEQKIGDYIKYSNKITSPSFRAKTTYTPNRNYSSIMKISDNSGFPYQEKWSPESEQTLKMSDYITNDFMLEKIKIKCNIRAQSKLNPDSIAALDLSNDDAYFGMSFFFLRNFIEDEYTKIKKNNITYHMQTNATGENIPDWLENDIYDTVFAESSETLTKINDDFEIIQGNFQKNEISYNVTISNHELDLDPRTNPNDFFGFANLTEALDAEGSDSRQIRISNNSNDFDNNIFTKIFDIEAVSKQTRPYQTNRDLVSFNNVIFYNLNINNDELDFLNNNKNIDILAPILNKEAPSEMTFEFDLKRTSNEKHTDESIFYNTSSGNNENLFIFEGKNTQNNSTRIFDLQNINQKLEAYYNNVNYKMYSGSYLDNIQNYNYLLKPSDELVFGITSYGNGNLISTLVELYDNIEIVLIGKEVNENFYRDESKSIRKVITSNIDMSKSNQENINSLNKNKSYFSSDNRILKDAKTNNNIYIYDSILPDFYQIFNLKEKVLYYRGQQFELGSTFVNNVTLFENDSTNYTDPDVVISNIFSNDIYDKYLFKEYENNQKFNNYRSVSNNLNRSVLNVENININLPDNSNLFDKDTSIISKISFDEKGIEENFTRDADFVSKLYPVLKTAYKNIETPLKKYASPYQNSDYEEGSNSDVFCSNLKPKNTGMFNFHFSDKNYVIDTNISDDDIFQTPISIRVFDKKAFLVIEYWPVGEKIISFWRNVNEIFKDDMIDVGDYSLSKFSIPLSLRRFYRSGDEVLGLSNTELFTKDFMYLQTENGGQQLICFLDYYEMSNNYYNFAINSINSSTSRTNVEEIEYDGISGSGSFIWDLVDNVLSLTQTWLISKNYSNSNIDYLKDENMNFSNMFFTLGIGNDSFSEESAKEDVGRFMFDNFKVDIHFTKYKTNVNSQNNVYKDNISNSLNFQNIDSRISKNYHYYMDRKLIETNVEDYHKVFDDRRIPSKKTEDFINNEMIYLAKLYYAKNINDSINDVQETKYSVIFKYISHLKNGINYPSMQIYSIINDFSFDTLIKLSYEDIALDFEDLSSGYLRIYEPYLLKAFKENVINENNVPYFEFNLADFTFKQKFANNVVQYNVWNESNLKYVSDSSTEYNYDYLIPNFNYFDESRGGERSYLSWGNKKSKEEAINSLVYLYGNKYRNYAIEKKAGFIYGVENSYPICNQQFFSLYRYGHFSDHIKYSKNYAKYNVSRNNSDVVSYPIEKAFYNEYFEKTTQDNASQTFNKNLYSQSSYPYIENVSNVLSQLNENNTLYDENNVF